MTITLENLKSFTDTQILEFANTFVDGETLQSAWNHTPHPESLFIDFYDEVMVDLYTKEQKAKVLQELKDDYLYNVEDEHMHITDLDELLSDATHLKEDAGEMAPEIDPKYEQVLDLYLFKWLLNSTSWGDEFLVAFANGSLDF